MRIGWLVNEPFEMVLIYQPPNADFVDFATQHNGGSGREKDL
jgi:hypothetical protein